jgi:glycine cleavage system H protein
MEFPDNLLYHPEHLWVSDNGDGIVTLGISDFAQHQLGEVIYADLPEVGDVIEAEDEMGGVESTKSVSDLISPVSGEVIEVNPALADAPALLNQEPYSGGWLIKVKLSGGLPEGLMNAADYRAGLELDK